MECLSQTRIEKKGSDAVQLPLEDMKVDLSPI